MKIIFTTTLKKFDAMGEKSGWTYIDIPAELALKLKPGNRKSFRVKGKLDDCAFNMVALVPMGEGDFIMAVNSSMRKETRKQKGDKIEVTIEADDTEPTINPQLLECLADEPEALGAFNKIPNSHRLYFSRWIDAAKTEPTKIKRIALAVNALARQMSYGEMIRSLKE